MSIMLQVLSQVILPGNNVISLFIIFEDLLLIKKTFLFTLVHVLGNTHLYPECESNNHMRLQNPGRRHNFNQISVLKDTALKAGWYRIFGQAGARLLDITDIPKNFSKRDIVRLFLFSTYVNNLVMPLHNFVLFKFTSILLNQ